MIHKEFLDYIVIGAGASGVVLTSLLSQKASTICLESHFLPGGCSGFYKRKKASFDVGATTLSGMAFDGPLQKFINLSGLQLELKKIDPGVVISLYGKKISRHRNLQNWIQEQRTLFPDLPLNTLWERVDALNHKAWGLLPYSKNFPPTNVTDVASLAFRDLFAKVSVLPFFTKSFHEAFLKDIRSHSYLNMLDELMLIAAQNTAKKTPALVGAMALSYTNDTWYPMGGMEAFSRGIEKTIISRGSQIAYRSKVESIIRYKDHFIVKTPMKSYRARTVISTLPIWNTLKLCDFQVPILEKNVRKNPPVWGAVTGYYTVKLKNQPESLYNQVHFKTPLSLTHSQSVFLSLSHKEDHKRVSNQDLQTLSVSAHINLERFQEALKYSTHAELKAKWDYELQQIIRDYFREDLIDLENYGIGDPLTFEKFTSRKAGSVGGLPHDLKKSLFFYPHSLTGVKNFFNIGDTTFPGQGIVGVIQGAMNLYEKIKP